MSQPESVDRLPVTERPPQADVAVTSEGVTTPVETVQRSHRSWLGFVVVGLLSGVAGGILINQSHEAFAVKQPKELAGKQGIFTPEEMALARAAQLVADYKNTPLAMGLLGLAVGASFGLAGGLMQRSPRSAGAGLVVGALSGGVLGALGGAAAVFVREQLRGWNTLSESGEPNSLLVQLHTMAIHLPTWIFIGVAVGLACGAARCGAPAVRTAGLAIFAVVLASVVYPTVASLVFQMDDPGSVVPGGSTNRLLWTTLSAGLIGLIAGRPDKSPAPSAAKGSA